MKFEGLLNGYYNYPKDPDAARSLVAEQVKLSN